MALDFGGFGDFTSFFLFDKNYLVFSCDIETRLEIIMEQSLVSRVLREGFCLQAYGWGFAIMGVVG